MLMFKQLVLNRKCRCLLSGIVLTGIHNFDAGDTAHTCNAQRILSAAAAEQLSAEVEKRVDQTAVR